MVLLRLPTCGFALAFLDTSLANNKTLFIDKETEDIDAN